MVTLQTRSRSNASVSSMGRWVKTPETNENEKWMDWTGLGVFYVNKADCQIKEMKGGDVDAAPLLPIL